MEILVEKPAPEKLKKLKTDTWPQWSCPVSVFDWSYDDEEACYFHEGKVIVRCGQDAFEINAGDFAVFPKGLSCRWEVLSPVRKVYAFGLGLIKNK